MNHFLRSTIILLLGLLLSGPCFSAEPPGAPFGLEWATSAEGLQTAGVTLTPVATKDGGKRFTATGLSKTLNDVDSVLLDFGYSNKLYRIAVASHDFPNDPYGNKVLGRYTELVSVLTSKYGTGSSRHHTGGSIYDERRYFLSGIEGGKNWHFTTFDAQGLSIEISVRAKTGDTGYWVLIYEYKSLAKEVEIEKAKREKGTL
jgi:hypothetical protein